MLPLDWLLPVTNGRTVFFLYHKVTVLDASPAELADPMQLMMNPFCGGASPVFFGHTFSVLSGEKKTWLVPLPVWPESCVFGETEFGFPNRSNCSRISEFLLFARIFSNEPFDHWSDIFCIRLKKLLDLILANTRFLKKYYIFHFKPTSSLELK